MENPLRPADSPKIESQNREIEPGTDAPAPSTSPAPLPCPAPSPSRPHLVERLEQLLNEVEIIKMNAMQPIVQQMNGAGPAEADLHREYQVALKSIEIQTKLILEGFKQEAETGGGPAALADIWQALIDLPQVGPLLRRDAVRERLLEALRQDLRG